MGTLLIAAGSFVANLIAYYTYGRWLGRKAFRLDAPAITPAADGNDRADFETTEKRGQAIRMTTALALVTLAMTQLMGGTTTPRRQGPNRKC